MKTATITFHAPNNNGSFFQAYALQKTLNNLGIENDIIDFQSKKQITQYSVFRPIKSIRDLAKNIVSLIHYRSLKEHAQRFSDMRNLYLKTTERCSTKEEVAQIANSYDVVIAGSDQIWNTSAPDFSEAYLLPDVSSEKMAYAVSLGSCSDQSELADYKILLERFADIAVREESGRDKLNTVINRDIKVTVDPTLLLEANDYKPMIIDDPIIKDEYIFFYSISYPTEVLKAVKKIGKQYGLKVVTVFTSFHTVKCEKYGIKIIYDAGPQEFLNLLINSKMVLTNSFHGTAFSVIFNKPFLHICKTIDGHLQRDDRIDGLIDCIGLQFCNIGVDSIPDNLPEIDWEKVLRNLGYLKNSSIDYLKNTLKKEEIV